MSLRQDMQRELDRYASLYDAGDAVGCANAYALAGRIYSPFGPAAIGRDAVRATHLEWFETPETNKRLTILGHGGSANAPWCLVAYSGEVLGPTGGPPNIEQGTSLTVWERDRAGDLKMLITSLNADFGDAESEVQTHAQNN
ncbi:MAG: YybH family protein [Boseongicola sp.]